MSDKVGGREGVEAEARDRPTAELGAELPGLRGVLSAETLFLLTFKSGTAGTSEVLVTLVMTELNQIKGGDEKSKVGSCTSRNTTLSFKEVRSNERRFQIFSNF